MQEEVKKNIISKLDNLERYTEIISTAAELLEEDFVSNPLNYGGASRYIILGLHNVREVSRLTNVQLNLEHCEYDYDLLKALTDRKVFPPWLAKNLLADFNDFREEQYCDLKDEHKLYSRLDKIVSNFRHFKKYFLEYLI